jgi:drug/metabolite transporter (DMT)-like permease
MLIELSILAALGAMVCWGFGDFFIQRTARKVGDIEALALLGIIGFFLLLPFAIPELPLLFSLENIELLAIIGLVTLGGAMLNFEALKKGKLSVVDVLFAIELPFTIAFGVIFFQEILSLPQTILILLIFAGIALISVRSLSNHAGQKILEKGIMLAILGSIGMALLNFLTAAGSRQVSPIMAVWVPLIVFTSICLFFIHKREGLKKFVKNAFSNKFTILGMGIFDNLAWLLFAIAVLKNELAITIAITESYPAIALLLGVFVNKEKIRIHQYAGAAIALIGSIALAAMA